MFGYGSLFKGNCDIFFLAMLSLYLIICNSEKKSHKTDVHSILRRKVRIMRYKLKTEKKLQISFSFFILWQEKN